MGMSSHGLAAHMCPLDLTLDVAQRLTDLRGWLAAWSEADTQLRHQVASLDPRRRADVLRGSQIASLRRQLAYQVTRQPIALDPEVVRGIGVANLRRHLGRQYAQLDGSDRQRWLANLTFLLTPSLQALITKLEAIRHYRSLGQQRCLLLGGVSGAGKSSVLNWYAVNYLPTVQAVRTLVPVIKIDAPVSNRSPKPLFQRMLLACGAVV
ncbi:MAG: hypothetical protein EOM24_12135, partial [Chloroflexia bacterium]|nr:hypothetical protein [Chloroflexia bacterium]